MSRNDLKLGTQVRARDISTGKMVSGKLINYLNKAHVTVQDAQGKNHTCHRGGLSPETMDFPRRVQK